jgi:hypothetical protein
VQDGVINVGGTYFDTSKVDDLQPNAFYPKVYKSGSTTELVPGQVDHQIPPMTSSMISDKQNTVGDVYILEQSETVMHSGGLDNVITLTQYTNDGTVGVPITINLAQIGTRATSTPLAPGKYTIDSATAGLKNESGVDMVGSTIYVFSDYDTTVDAFGINSLTELQMVD